MGKRCVSKFIVDNTDFPIMQISDFSIIPNRVDNSAYQYDYYQSLQPPSGVSSVGNSFNSMVGDIITSGSVVKNVENFNNVTVGRYYEYGYGHQINSIYVNDENSNMLFGFGAYIDNEERDCTYYASIILDDDSEYADVITMYSYVSRGWTKLWHFGGNGTLGKKLYQYFNTIIKYTSNGGGATHIAKVTGQLKDLSSNLSDILMVSGGGGGGLLVGDTDYSGKEAGGISGSGDNSADQSTGNAFGQGESGTNVSGGGSGLYGGYKGTSSKSGGAGSGYIGNSLLSNKKMVGYNVPTSSAEATKTESVNEASESPVSGKPKSGNGFARIKLVQSAQQKVDISASNQLKNKGVSPTVIMGTLGEYDTQTQSYYFSDICSFSYSNAVISKSELLNAKRLYLEMELRLDNESVGINIDATIHIRYGTDGYRLLGVVAGNGESGTGDYSFFWMDNGTVQKNDTAPLDVSANRGAFHKVKFELLMSNGTVATMNCYLDGVLYKTKSVNEAFVLDYDEYIIYCDIIKYAYVKSYKVEVI